MRAFALLVLLSALGCSRPAARLPDAALPASDGVARRLADVSRGARFTVVTFFSADCPCQRAHDDRLRELHARYRPLGVEVVAVDSEATASPAADAAEARARRYPFPILTDPEGAVADALGAEFATHTVILDSSGRVRFRGGIDSDRHTTTEGAAPWLRDALDRLLAGAEPAAVAGEAMGCALRRK